MDTACKLVVPGHGKRGESIEATAASNRSLAMDVADCIVGLAEQPSTAESLFVRVLEKFDAPVSSTRAYFLLHPTICAFLSYLEGGRDRERDGWQANGLEGSLIWIAVQECGQPGHQVEARC